jgi:pimeloyl-ACP methyl ester carboxylesterase
VSCAAVPVLSAEHQFPGLRHPREAANPRLCALACSRWLRRKPRTPDAFGIARAQTWSQEFVEARRQSVSVPHDYTQDLAGIQAPVLLILGRYDRMVLLNNCGHWPPFETEWTAQVLAFLQGY